jgi:hypothetical protein
MVNDYAIWLIGETFIEKEWGPALTLEEHQKNSLELMM